MNEAMRDWVTNVDNTHYIIGSVAGPHPYPMLVRDFQAVIGREARDQCLAAEGRLPDLLVACVGRRVQCNGALLPVRRRRRRGHRGRRSGRRRVGDGTSCGAPERRHARGAAWEPHLPDGRFKRPDRRDAFRFRRSRLSRRGARARLLEGSRAGQGTPALRTRKRWRLSAS